MTSNVTPLYPPDDVHELASQALFSLPASYPIAHLGDDWLRVRDLHEALTTAAMDPLSVLDCLHYRTAGSLVRPDLVEAVVRLLEPFPPPATYLCACLHAQGFHDTSYGPCKACRSCAGFRFQGRAA